MYLSLAADGVPQAARRNRETGIRPCHRGHHRRDIIHGRRVHYRRGREATTQLAPIFRHGARILKRQQPFQRERLQVHTIRGRRFHTLPHLRQERHHHASHKHPNARRHGLTWPPSRTRHARSEKSKFRHDAAAARCLL